MVHQQQFSSNYLTPYKVVNIEDVACQFEVISIEWKKSAAMVTCILQCPRQWGEGNCAQICSTTVGEIVLLLNIQPLT